MIVSTLVMMALAQAPAGSATLSGKVVDAAGRPAAGVEVVLSMGRGLWECPVSSRVKSDPDGTFRIDVPAEKDPRRARNYLAALGPCLGKRVRRASAPAGEGAGSTEAGRSGAHGFAWSDPTASR